MNPNVSELDIQRGAGRLRESWNRTDAEVSSVVRAALAVATGNAVGEFRRSHEAATIRELVDSLQRLRRESRDSLEALLGYLTEAQRRDLGALV